MATCPNWIGNDMPVIVRDGEEYFLLSYRNSLYLVRNRCPHRGGPLKFGFINERDEIICPMHHNAFPIAGLIAQASTILLTESLVASP